MMNIRRIILSAFLTLATITGAWAVKAWPGIHTQQQSDGSLLNYRVLGDEHCHAFATIDGYLLVPDDKGYMRYARPTGRGGLMPSNLMAHDLKLRSDNERKELESWGVNNFGRIYSEQTSKGMRNIKRLPGEVFPTQGNLKGIILFVEFADNSMQEGHDSSLFHNLMNEPDCTRENATGSARDYFVDQSSGLFTPEFDVVGPIKLSHRMAYYGANNSQGQDSKPGLMVKEACEYAADSLGVDFSNYDFDNDGTVDFVYVIYAGYAESYGASSNTIWPHASQLSLLGIGCSVSGKTVNRYACSSELKYATGTRVEGIGTFCHEFSHVLGLPDMYNTSTTSVDEVGTWDVMDQGNYNNESHTPPSMSAFERMSLGWLELTEIDTPADSISLDEMTQNNVAYRISTADANEYFTLENRQQVKWDAYHPGRGLMIMHITYDESAWNNNYVNAGTYPRYDLVEADGTQGNGEATDLFPTATNNMFTDYSSPNSLSRSGVPTEKGLTNIRDNDGVISFTFMKDRLRRPVLEEASDITDHSFTVNWNEVEGAIGYSLHIDEQLPDSLNPLLLDEDFDTLTDGCYPKSGADDISETIEGFLSGSPWYGSLLYSCGGYLRIGGYGQSGKLYTPIFNGESSDGTLTLSLDARSYPAKNVAFTVDMVDTATGDIVASQTFKANRTEENYHIVFHGAHSNSRFIITTKNERLFVNRMRVLKGDVDSLYVWTVGPQSWNVDSIMDTSYTVEGLAAQRTYTYNVTAIAAEAMQSSMPSATGSVETVATSTGIVGVDNADLTLRRVEYYDVEGRRIESKPSGFVIWRKVFSDGTVKTGKGWR